MEEQTKAQLVTDFETEQKELEKDGWTIEEARKFAQFLIKTQ